jgi:two-component system, OmpR family, KDP operon response regulator KdpE
LSKALARVLVIDDEPQIHRLLRSALGASGFAVERADSASEGLRLARSGAPDAVLLDLTLPDLNGHEVLARLRSFSCVPVIMLSARNSETDKIAALDGGADDYVLKPFAVGELMARIRVAMRHRRAEEGISEVMHFPGLTVDISRRRVVAKDDLVVLNAKEWELLSLLARNAGRVLTHRQLLTAVWGPAHTDNTQYLRVYIATLRQKLGTEGELIATSTGVGYRMADYIERPANEHIAF